MDENYLTLLAGEAFLRRVAQQDAPFMLKGSFLTRQYLPKQDETDIKGLDWVYIGEETDANAITEIFFDWVNTVINIEIEDSVKFQAPDEHLYWMNVDYYTLQKKRNVIELFGVHGNILLHGEEKWTYLELKLTFNLNKKPFTTALIYDAMQGDSFLIHYTDPLYAQIAWNLYQIMVRPKVKDIETAIGLLQHPTFDPQSFQHTLQALVNECQPTKVNMKELDYFMSDKAEKSYQLYTGLKIKDKTEEKKQIKEMNKKNIKFIYPKEAVDKIVYSFDQLICLLSQFKIALNNAGFTSEILKNLPKPN